MVVAPNQRVDINFSLISIKSESLDEYFEVMVKDGPS